MGALAAGVGRYGLHYQQRITEMLGVTPAMARLVYAGLLVEHVTLDGLALAELEREARSAAAEVVADPVMAERIAVSCGL